MFVKKQNSLSTIDIQKQYCSAHKQYQAILPIGHTSQETSHATLRCQGTTSTLKLMCQTKIFILSKIIKNSFSYLHGAVKAIVARFKKQTNIDLKITLFWIEGFS